jgi:hypothetical protein
MIIVVIHQSRVSLPSGRARLGWWGVPSDRGPDGGGDDANLRLAHLGGPSNRYA